ncbi:hypothetical protein F2Q68_00036870 [Brassica cretica]|uniref:Uncharacterized protein n=1 Tax=Brassica cretica TaxID=69181 RepID=A0A8S9GYC7_BRACR|nr:hypothetical protein F2Q68_00036870 [Brassica cretica]
MLQQFFNSPAPILLNLLQSLNGQRWLRGEGWGRERRSTITGGTKLSSSGLDVTPYHE